MTRNDTAATRRPAPGRTSRRTLLAGGVAAGAWLLGACGGRGSEGQSTPPPPEKGVVRVGVLPVPDVAALHLGIRDGIFARHGLHLDLVSMDLTGENRVDLDAGPVDVLFDSWVSVFTNYGGNRDLRLVGEAYQSAPLTTGLVTPRDSTYRKPRDRPKPRIAVNNPKGLGVLLTSTALHPHGVAAGDIQWAHLPFEAMSGAMTRGEVDAAWLIEPYLTGLQISAGTQLFADTATGPTADMPLSGYVCGRKFAERNPRTLAAFRAALTEAQHRAGDRAEVAKVLPSYAGIDPSTVALMAPGVYPPTLTAVKIQRVADLMRAYNLLPAPIQVNDFIAR
ncbi:ABC transporter substrate-binding protein [Streptoalloteichus hindustanus]|uniref:NitT/TauT family transport system substrate-binding protein n=1 Tax=Streptoalloteichus hindustanus TaxID=2017 RepID=A0A1M5GD41_STRHI|nr:ABC transporter substrate-binding protein [Streptoalloteichus hindustanus]SHG01675.1 NitT/TauT family transport system substrate-binding protein [Streptoalloteichus hindustanus]